MRKISMIAMAVLMFMGSGVMAQKLKRIFLGKREIAGIG